MGIDELPTGYWPFTCHDIYKSTQKLYQTYKHYPDLTANLGLGRLTLYTCDMCNDLIVYQASQTYYIHPHWTLMSFQQGTDLSLTKSYTNPSRKLVWGSRSTYRPRKITITGITIMSSVTPSSPPYPFVQPKACALGTLFTTNEQRLV
jgi:hypothetical protein